MRGGKALAETLVLGAFPQETGDHLGAVTAPVLIVYCSSDFITQMACHEAIRDVLVASGNPDVTLEIISGTDHAYAFAKDKRESYDNWKTRNFRGNPESIRQVTEWLARHRD